MSTTSSPAVDQTIERCRPTDVTPVQLTAADLESTAPSYLRTLKRACTNDGLDITELSVSACFDADCSLRTQDEVDRLRRYVRAGVFLGVGTITVSIDDVENPEKVRPALAACAERAERDGLTFELDAPSSLES